MSQPQENNIEQFEDEDQGYSTTDTELHLRPIVNSAPYYTDSYSIVSQIDMEETRPEALIRVAGHCFDKLVAVTANDYVIKRKRYSRMKEDLRKVEIRLGYLLTRLEPTPAEKTELKSLIHAKKVLDKNMKQKETSMQNNVNKMAKLTLIKRSFRALEGNTPGIYSDLKYFTENHNTVNCLESDPNNNEPCECPKHYIGNLLYGLLKPSTSERQKESMPVHLEEGNSLVHPMQMILVNNYYAPHFEPLRSSLAMEDIHAYNNPTDIVDIKKIWEMETKEDADTLKRLEIEKLIHHLTAIQEQLKQLMAWESSQRQSE